MKINKKVILSVTSAILLMSAAVIVFVTNNSSEKIGPGNIPNAKIEGETVSVGDGCFNVLTQKVVSDKDFGKTFSENEIITVYTENASDTENGSDNVITNTKTISVGDRVEIVYYQHNSDLKDKKIFSADISRTQE